jgi:hypothetical protein
MIIKGYKFVPTSHCDEETDAIYVKQFQFFDGIESFTYQHLPNLNVCEVANLINDDYECNFMDEGQHDINCPLDSWREQSTHIVIPITKDDVKMINVDERYDIIKMCLKKKDGSEIRIYSEHEIYVMNDSGKTIEIIRPLNVNLYVDKMIRKEA